MSFISEDIERFGPRAIRDELDRRAAVADEMLALLIDQIGTGPGVAEIRRQAKAIKDELRGLTPRRSSTTPN